VWAPRLEGIGQLLGNGVSSQDERKLLTAVLVLALETFTFETSRATHSSPLRFGIGDFNARPETILGHSAPLTGFWAFRPLRLIFGSLQGLS
jgi:hypothetical protein